MPIIDKNKSATDLQTIPSGILDALQEAVEFQRLKDIYAEKYEETRDAAIDKIAESREVTLVVGETLETPVCDVVSYYKQVHKYDVDLMVKLVEDKKVSLRAFLSCVKGYDPALVTAVFAGHAVLATEKAKRPVFSLRATADTVAALNEQAQGLEIDNPLRRVDDKSAA